MIVVVWGSNGRLTKLTGEETVGIKENMSESLGHEWSPIG